MSDPGTSPAAAEKEDDAAAKQRRRAKMQRGMLGPTTHAPRDMGVVGAIQALKAEADAFEACLEHIVKGGTDKFNPYLSGSSGSAHYTEQSDAQVTSNDDLYKTVPFKCNERTGTMKHTLDPVMCLGVHVALIEKLTVSHHIEDDGLPSLTLDARGGQVAGNLSKSGGFTVLSRVPER